jgi:hypothetical protein
MSASSKVEPKRLLVSNTRLDPFLAGVAKKAIEALLKDGKFDEAAAKLEV